MGAPAYCQLVELRGRCVTRAPHRCAAGGAVAGVVQRSACSGDRTAHDRSGSCAARRDGSRSAHRTASGLLGTHGISQLEFRRQALGERLPAPRRGAEVRNGCGDNCRRHRHRGQRLATGARGARRRLRGPSGQRHVRLRFPRHADRVDHRRPARADGRVHRRRARRPDPVVASDVRGVSTRRRTHRSQRPEHHADCGVTAKSGARGRARGQPRRAGHQHQRGGLLQGDQADRRNRPRRRDQLRGQRQGSGHHRRGRQHRPGLQSEPAARSRGTRRSARLEAGTDDRQSGVVLAAGAHRRRHRPERSAEHLLDVRPMGRRRGAGGEHGGARLRRKAR